MDFLAPPPPIRGHITPSDTPTLARVPSERERYGAKVFFRTEGSVVERIDRKKKTRPARRIPVVEFTAASHERVEPGFDATVTPGAAAVPLTGSPFDVPASGFMRHLCILVTASGGVAGTLAADGPWSVIQEVALMDVGGAPIFGPMTGYQAFLANLYGGYAFYQDPRIHPDYTETVTAPVFMLRVPVEINHNNGFGALGNQNSAAAYKVRLTVAPSTTVFSVAPTTIPAFRFRLWVETWTQPTETDLAGRPQAQAPPRHGTTQYWSIQGPTDFATAGPGIRLARVGNLIRTLILIARTAAGARDTTLFPADSMRIIWDQRELDNAPRFMRRAYMAERFLHATGGVPAGVLAYPFSHDMMGHGGDGTAELYIPTVQATRFEVGGLWTAAGNLTMIVNEIAPVEIQPEDRYEEFSETGFTPELGVPVRNG